MHGTPKTAMKARVRRSAITSGRKLFIGDVDMRTSYALRYRDLIDAHTADLGGNDAMSEGERALVRSAATLRINLESLETTFATECEATTPQLELYTVLTNALSRVLSKLGLRRRAKTVPNLKDYVASKRRARSPLTIDHEDDD